MSKPITLKKKRETANYVIYETTESVPATNAKGDQVRKAAVLGGNGTVYVAMVLAGTEQAWHLVPDSLWRQLQTVTGRFKTNPELQHIPAEPEKKSTVKGKKK